MVPFSKPENYDPNQYELLLREFSTGWRGWFNKFDDIPSSFEHLISFKPDYPPEPHNEEQHNQMSKFDNYLKELMTRASGN